MPERTLLDRRILASLGPIAGEPSVPVEEQRAIRDLLVLAKAFVRLNEDDQKDITEHAQRLAESRMPGNPNICWLD